jgi:nucleotide-binding universal stress UspA family protein
MFRNILVPVDLTDRHAPALEIAGQLARSSGGTVTVLHVIELLHGSGREDEPAFYDRLERKARGHLDRLAEQLRARQVTAKGNLLFGERGREVLGYAQEHGADLIVLMSHPVDPAQPGMGWNTLSYFIGVAARCPVLLVK